MLGDLRAPPVSRLARAALLSHRAAAAAPAHHPYTNPNHATTLSEVDEAFDAVQATVNGSAVASRWLDDAQAASEFAWPGVPRDPGAFVIPVAPQPSGPGRACQILSPRDRCRILRADRCGDSFQRKGVRRRRRFSRTQALSNESLQRASVTWRAISVGP